VESKSQLGRGTADVARSELDGYTDEDLLIQIQRGQRDSIERLYRRHGPSILALLTRIVDDYQLAEEAMQDTFLAVWNGARFEGRSRVRTWLVGIALRQAGSKRRKNKPSLATDIPDLVSPEPGPEEEAVVSLEVSRLVKELSHLSERQREVLLLTFVEQLTQMEIAELLGVRLGTVKSRIHSAKRALERRWQEDSSK
jgi:RNA polymerase sigma factor (sigma-70 family)